MEEANLVCGRKPLGIAAGAVYAAGVESRWEDRPTQRVIASAVSVSTDVVCNRYQEIREGAEANGEWEGS